VLTAFGDVTVGFDNFKQAILQKLLLEIG